MDGTSFLRMLFEIICWWFTIHSGIIPAYCSFEVSVTFPIGSRQTFGKWHRARTESRAASAPHRNFREHTQTQKTRHGFFLSLLKAGYHSKRAEHRSAVLFLRSVSRLILILRGLFSRGLLLRRSSTAKINDWLWIRLLFHQTTPSQRSTDCNQE